MKKFLSSLGPRNRYIPAFLLLMLLSTLGYINLQELSSSITNDGKLINISGRQRMLSQKLVILARNHYDNFDQNSYKELYTNTQLMEDSYHYLLENTSSEKISTEYYNEEFDKEFKKYILQLKTLLKNRNHKILKELKSNSQILLNKLDLIVQAYELEYDKKINHLERKGLHLLLGILFVLLFEAIFIFYPASRKIKEKTKELETTLKHKSNELQKSIDIISDYVIFSRTDKKGIITYASNAFCKICGYTKEELIGKPHNIVRHPDMPKLAFKKMWDTLKSGKRWNGEVKNLKKDGGYYWVEAHISADYDSHGNFIGYAGVRLDITHKKELEELNKNLELKIKNEIEKNREKDKLLFERAKSSQLNEMIENIAHHWRQPLSIISVCATGLQMKQEIGILKEEDLEKSLLILNDTTQTLSQTIEEFSHFINLNQEKQFFELKKLINKTLTIVKPSFDSHNIYIDCVYDQTPIEISSIPSELSEVLLNILYNSKEAFERNQIVDKKITIEILKQNEYILLSIIDNGGGMKSEHLPKIFDPYFTTKHKFQGVGLGLHMAQTIINKHLKGQISAANKDNGLMITLELPINS